MANREQENILGKRVDSSTSTTAELGLVWNLLEAVMKQIDLGQELAEAAKLLAKVALGQVEFNNNSLQNNNKILKELTLNLSNKQRGVIEMNKQRLHNSNLSPPSKNTTPMKSGKFDTEKTKFASPRGHRNKEQEKKKVIIFSCNCYLCQSWSI